MPSIGWPELIIILIVALIVFGPQRVAGIGGALGHAIREFGGAVRDTETELEQLTAPEQKHT